MPKPCLRMCLWAACCFLSTRPASSSAQALRPLRPLLARVVLLDSGAVAVRAYTCMDSSAYRALLHAAGRVPGLTQQLALSDYARHLLEQQAAGDHREARAAHADFAAEQATARQLEAQAPRPPLLLDGRVYASAGAGITAGIVAALLYGLLRP